MNGERSQFKAAVLLGALSAVVLVLGYRLGGGVGFTIAFVIAMAALTAACLWGDQIALRSMRAYPVSEAEHPVLCQLVRELSQTMRLPMPAVYVSPTPAPNAFAIGRSPRRAAICVTEGLVSMLDRRELRAVVAHELGHVANRDIFLSSVGASLASIIVFLAHLAWLLPFGRSEDEETSLPGLLLLIVLGPAAAIVVQLAISRSREFAADGIAARVTGDPEALAEALRKLEEGTKRLPLRPLPALQSTGALMIANPFRRGGLLTRLFSTHPSANKRIARLETLSR